MGGLRQKKIEGIKLTKLFPSPLEVDRFLYDETRDKGAENITFPSPTEVDRVFYYKPEFTVEPEGVMFSSPLEVNRVSYKS